MATQIGKGHIHGFGTAAFGCSTLSGYVSPKMETLRLTHTGEIDKIKALSGGNTEAMISSDEKLECTFDVLPSGATFAESLEAAGLPALLAAFTITGLQIIEVGSWVNALNTNGAGVSANLWIYEGGGTINGFIDQKWTLSLPLHRYVGIATVTVIV